MNAVSLVIVFDPNIHAVVYYAYTHTHTFKYCMQIYTYTIMLLIIISVWCTQFEFEMFICFYDIYLFGIRSSEHTYTWLIALSHFAQIREKL